MDHVPGWLMAGFWGWVAGSALLIGAAVGYLVSIPLRFTALIMAFGSGVLISALTLELMNEAYKEAGLLPTTIGFLAGALIFSAANWYLERRGAKHRKHAGAKQSSESEDSGSGLAIAVGALLDGIPESIAIGLTMIHGGGVSTTAVIAIFVSNVPEGLSSSSGMKKSGRSLTYVFGLWGAICLISGVASIVGYSVFGNLSHETNAATTALAAGAMLAMIADTMMPEAFEKAHNLTGLVTVAGFLVSFLLSKSV